VVLEAQDGATQTIKVPSKVLNGITTPGSVVYFNEFTAMPEQAQIFLHSLMDEKREMTLKTSSGKVVKVLPSVLLVASENPNYPGTFKPQFATRSRMVSLEIGYPPLTREPALEDKNRNELYDASEPLRIARELESLVDLTYENNLQNNAFVKLWDKYVNGLENGSPDPTTAQKFDLDAILAITQFTHKLREDFIKNFEKTRDAKNALPIDQPVTGRELRRCAYSLNKLSETERVKTDPEKFSKELLEKFFLTNIDSQENREKIKRAMATWSSQKRLSI
jgi:MoxR-like ATPase